VQGFAGIAAILLLLFSQPRPSIAQEPLHVGIQNVTRQIIASMELQQKRKLAVVDFTRVDGSADSFGQYIAERLIPEVFNAKRFEVVVTCLGIFGPADA
jgi:hypothetical protein